MRKSRRRTIKNGSNGEGGQISIDFLTGMTIFALTLLFVFQFMTSMVIPYTTSSPEVVQISGRASDTIYTNFTTDWETKTPMSPGVFDNRTVKAYINGQNLQEIKNSLGIGSLYNINITITNLDGEIINSEGDPSSPFLTVGGTPGPDDSVSVQTRLGYMKYREPISKGSDTLRAETVIVKIRVWI